ncbi:unnamed protein product [Victoria cruziana]
MGSLARGVHLHHIAKQTNDVGRLAQFYQEILGFERTENPDLGFEVVWLKLPPSFSLHIIKKSPESRLPESPWSSSEAIKDPRHLPRGHHISFAVSNYDSFVQGLKEKGIQVHEGMLPDGRTKQVFFFDPDGNGLEVGSWEAPQ